MWTNIKNCVKDSISEETKETKAFSERLFSRNKKLKALEVVKKSMLYCFWDQNNFVRDKPQGIIIILDTCMHEAELSFMTSKCYTQ